MKRSQLALAVAGLLASSTSFALQDATLATAPDYTYFAKGMKASSTSLVMLPAGNSDILDATFKVGFGIPKNTEQFIRVDLSEGATFAAEPECTSTAGIADIACNKRGVASLNKRYATFAIKNPNSDIPAGEKVTIRFATADKTSGAAGIKVTDTSKPVTMTFSLHNNDVSVDAGLNGTGLLQSSKKEVKYVAFRDVINARFTGYMNTPSTSDSVAYSANLESDVGADFKQFVSSAPVAFGRLQYGAVTGTNLNTTDGTNYKTPYAITDASDVTHLLGTGSTLEFSGNFSFLQDLDSSNNPAGTYNSATSKVFLTQVGLLGWFGACGNASLANADVVDGNKITFKIDAKTVLAGKDLVLCVTPNAAVPIEEFVATARFNPVGKYELALNGVTLDKFTNVTQNGTVLDSPFLSTNPAYVNRLIITNTSPKPLKYKVLEIVGDGGDKLSMLNAANSSGVIPANANLFLKVEDLVNNASTLVPGRVAVRISIAGSNKVVQGVAQSVRIKSAANGNTMGDTQTVPMVRKCGGSGCN